MAYYVCHDCHKVFHEDDAWKVSVKYFDPTDGFLTNETTVRCPYCGGEDYGEAVECIQCGALKAPPDLRGGYYCDECLSALSTMQTIRDFIAENVDCYAEFLREQYEEG